jgi:hypothetical protein
MKFLLFPVIIIMGLFISASAQDATEEATEQKYYDIEIVIFKNIKGPHSREFNIPVKSPSVPAQVFDLSSTESVNEGLEWQYQIVPLDELRLVDSVVKITASDRYQMILHTAWRQPGQDLEETIPVWIRGGKIFGPEYSSIDNHINQIEDFELQFKNSKIEKNDDNQSAETTLPETLDVDQPINNETQKVLYELEGQITVGLSRYLHSYVDLVLRRPRNGANSNQPVSSIQQLKLTNQVNDLILKNHSLKEHRRMRSKKLHYLDSPYFSMLMLINQYDPEATTLQKIGDKPEQGIAEETQEPSEN